MRSGNDAVQWLMQDQGCTRGKACQLGQWMLEAHFYVPLGSLQVAEVDATMDTGSAAKNAEEGSAVPEVSSELAPSLAAQIGEAMQDSVGADLNAHSAADDSHMVEASDGGSRAAMGVEKGASPAGRREKELEPSDTNARFVDENVYYQFVVGARTSFPTEHFHLVLLT